MVSDADVTVSFSDKEEQKVSPDFPESEPAYFGFFNLYFSTNNLV